VKWVSHDCRAQDLVFVGTTKTFGNKVFLNRTFAESDVRILTGDICLHNYAGYSGGHVSVLPGIAGESTIKHNHAMLLDARAKAGVLEGNPVYVDMVEASGLAKVDFVLNTVSNTRGEAVRAFAGDMEQAFVEGVKLVDEMYRIPVDRRADIVVVSAGGYPTDVSLFEACEAVNNALEIVKRGGVIVLVAECSEGHGNEVFHDWMVRFHDLKTAEREIKRNFVWGGHKTYYLLHALQNHTIILVSSMPDYYAAQIFRLKTARAVNDALNDAFNIVGRNGRVWAMPLGSFTLPEIRVTEKQAEIAEVAQ
jgi:nickel-dependent lactate racemase